jgi:hypothetical protein
MAWKRCIAAGKRQLKAVIATRPALAAASTMARASTASMASGFSQSTCAPPAKAWRAIALCRTGGAAITTMAGRARSSISSQRVKTWGTP